MILSVSRRTDIPAFYPDWFMNRIREGFVLVRGPRDPNQVSRVAVTPDVVDCIVFWSKNPAPLLPYLDKLAGYAYYFQYTLNAYGPEVEPRLPPLEERIDTFLALSKQLGKERVIWRYDPILFSEVYTPRAHLDAFARIAGALGGLTEKCVISLVDRYPTKNAQSLARLGERLPDAAALDAFFAALAAIARENGLILAGCAEAILPEKYGITQNRCIDPTLIERITGTRLRVGPDGQRPNCLCAKCEDIGSYDTCPHGCVYCYANFRAGAVADKQARYDPASPLLCDTLTGRERISTRPARSLKLPESDAGQLSLY